MTSRKDTRARIVGGALELILRHGLAKTTVEDIAREARLKPASIYYYFASKEEVFAEVVREASRQVLTRVGDAVAAADTGEAKLMAFFEARYSYLKLLDGVTQSVAVELYPKVEEAIVEFELQGRGLLEQILREGVERGEFVVDDPAALALGVVTGMRGMDSMFVVHRSDRGPMEGLLALLRTFLRGLRARSGEAR